MKNLKIIIKSINKNSIYKFLVLFQKNNILKNQSYRKIIKKKITILKSPHIHKKAQEQFEKKKFKIIINVGTKHLFQYLILLKKLKNFAFSDCYICIKYKINNAILNSKFFNFICFKINKYSLFFFVYKKQNKILLLQHFFLINNMNSFLKMFEIFGEILKYKKF